jgi:hypothetical protein
MKKKLPSCPTESSSKHTLDKTLLRANPSAFCNASSITTLHYAFQQVSNALQTLVFRFYASHFKDSCISCCVSVAPLVGRISRLALPIDDFRQLTATSTTVLRRALIRDLGKLFRVDLTLPLISLKIEVFESPPPRHYLNPLLLRPHITIGAQVWLLLYDNMVSRHSSSCESDLEYEFSTPCSPSSRIRLRLPRNLYRPTSSSDRAFYRHFPCSLRQLSTQVPPQITPQTP